MKQWNAGGKAQDTHNGGDSQSGAIVRGLRFAVDQGVSVGQQGGQICTDFRQQAQKITEKNHAAGAAKHTAAGLE